MRCQRRRKHLTWVCLCCLLPGCSRFSSWGTNRGHFQRELCCCMNAFWKNAPYLPRRKRNKRPQSESLKWANQSILPPEQMQEFKFRGASEKQETWVFLPVGRTQNVVKQDSSLCEWMTPISNQYATLKMDKEAKAASGGWEKQNLCFLCVCNCSSMRMFTLLCCFCNYHPESRGFLPQVRLCETLGWLDGVWPLTVHKHSLKTPIS